MAKQCLNYDKVCMGMNNYCLLKFWYLRYLKNEEDKMPYIKSSHALSPQKLKKSKNGRKLQIIPLPMLNIDQHY